MNDLRFSTRVQLFFACTTALLLFPTVLPATWSINVVDTKTKEVAVGIATCLDNIDLLKLAPVVVVNKGTGSSQSFVDVDGTRRATIFTGLLNETPPPDILTALEALPGHQTRQYGIADTNGNTLTFSGTANFPFAGGAVGSSGSIAYAVQGNILTGMPVVAAAVEALLTTTGALPAKLMAAMQAARAMGGDGRCSCPMGPEATSCGSPPPSFSNSAINGGMIVSRVGDQDDSSCDANGCTDGDYFMTLNVAGDMLPNVDPVIQLQAQFDAFRSELEGRPDAIQSLVSFHPGNMTVSLLDWRGAPIDVPITDFTVQHALDSDILAVIGPPVDNADGTFDIALSNLPSDGSDRFVVSVDDGIRPVTLMPNPTLNYTAIDIKPGSSPNSINPLSKGVVPVAILGSATFNVAAVDMATVEFGANSGSPIHNLNDAAVSAEHLTDVNGDGNSDLVLHFKMGETGIVCGDTEASLTGETLSGDVFLASDVIRTVSESCFRATSR
jgi:hypothetical protein